MAKNEFLPFGTAEGANVLSNQEYEALAARHNGFTSGVAKSKELNKVWRQASLIASAVAQFIADTDQKDLLDTGDVADIKSRLASAINLIISNGDYVTNPYLKLELLKKIDKADITQQLGNDTGKVVSQNLLATELGKKASVADVNGKMAKDQNGADIPDKPKFIENLGLEEVFAKKNSSDPLTTGTLHINPFGDVTSCAFHREDGSYVVIETSVDGSMYLVNVNKDGVTTGKITFPAGYGTLLTKGQADNHYPLKTDLGTAAKKNTGAGSGQIPDMSYFISTKTSSAIVEQLPTGIIRMSGVALVSTDINGNCWVQLPSIFPNKVMFYAGEQNGSNYAGDSSPWLFTPYTNDEAGVTRLSFAVRRSTTGEVMKNDTISMKFTAEGY